MSDVLTVFRKELSELFGEKHSRRGLLVQSLLMTLSMGVLPPYVSAPQWRDGSPTVVILFFFMPGMLAATVAADAFAGERERKTLETLLASPLSERSIVLGKAMTSILFGFGTCVLALIGATISVNVKLGGLLFFPSLEVLRGVLGAGFASATATTAIAIHISMRMPIARSAQQMCAVVSMALVGLVAASFYFGKIPFTWPNVYTTESVVLLLGAVGLRIAAAVFSRARFFDGD